MKKRKSQPNAVWDLIPTSQRYWIDGSRWVAIADPGKHSFSLVPFDALTPDDIARIQHDAAKYIRSIADLIDSKDAASLND